MFEPKELLSYSEIKKMNQKKFLKLLENGKIGIFIKDKIEGVIISIEEFEKLKNGNK